MAQKNERPMIRPNDQLCLGEKPQGNQSDENTSGQEAMAQNTAELIAASVGHGKSITPEQIEFLKKLDPRKFVRMTGVQQAIFDNPIGFVRTFSQQPELKDQYLSVLAQCAFDVHSAGHGRPEAQIALYRLDPQNQDIKNFAAEIVRLAKYELEFDILTNESVVNNLDRIKAMEPGSLPELKKKVLDRVTGQQNNTAQFTKLQERHGLEASAPMLEESRKRSEQELVLIKASVAKY